MSTYVETPCNQHSDCPVWFDADRDLEEGAVPYGYRVIRRDGADVLQRKCTQHRHHADDWFEDPGSGRETLAGRARRRARDACFVDCPMKMRLACLNLGMQPENLFHGIWGGYTEAQRQEVADGIAARRASVGRQE